MADVHSRAVRSKNMSRIRGQNTQPEMIVRRGLHAAGFRFRLHDRKLPGRPDIVLRRYNAVIFVHGCFWHGHDCALFRWPATRPDFWRDKIGGNRARDTRRTADLLNAGWRVATVWECALKGRGRLPGEEVTGKLATWLHSTSDRLDLRGTV
ncbi:very short patch repair endonuclease [uncultured Roseobacter sp.]|uniref:very short patch repair endonuclease n=1 Tax=uncultured Roseobacter sp. TaxID=114847 RepID=UPI002639FAEF|nr:very short patch repair endonuclease [uncultured Roseobacter sp.]